MLVKHLGEGSRFMNDSAAGKRVGTLSSGAINKHLFCHIACEGSHFNPLNAFTLCN